MGLCLLLETIEVFEELRLAFLMGDQFALSLVRIGLHDRSSNMDAKQVWNDDFQDARNLGIKMRVAFGKYGNVKIAEAHIPHPRHDCIVLEETEFEAVLTQCDSSTTGIGGFLDDLPAS